MLVRVQADRLYQSRVDPGQVPAFDHRACGNFEEVEYLADPQPVAAALDLDDDNCALIRRASGLLQQDVSIEHREEAAANIYQPLDRTRHAWNSGSRQAREDLTHDPCRGRADNLTDAKDDGVKRGRVSHLY